MQLAEDLVEFVNGEDLADSGVMIPDGDFLVARGVEIAHAGFRAANEGGVAENDRRLLGAAEKGPPESLKGGGSRLAGGVTGQSGGRCVAIKGQGQERDAQQKGENDDGSEPATGDG